MKEEEFQPLRERIRAILDRWHDALGLKWWRLSYVYDRQYKEGNRACAADCHAKWEYLDAEVTFYLPRIFEACLDDEDGNDLLEYTVVHELMHILLNEMRDDEATGRIAHEERVATTLAHAFRWVRDFTAEGKGPSMVLRLD